MAWIESHTVLIRHRKVIQLAIALQLEPVVVIGHLHALWHAVLEQQEDGDLSTWPDTMIALAAAFTGDAALFVRELQAKKLLDGKLVHDWLDYAGRYLTNKYRTSNRRKLKEIFRLHQSVYKSVSSQTKVRLQSAHHTRPNQPNLTRPDRTEPEDKTSAPVERSAVMKVVPHSKTQETWEAYRRAYEDRYHAPPVRNAKVNGTLARLVDRIGADAAPKVAAYYLMLNDPFYLRVQHTTDILLRDCEGLHTQWITGKRPNVQQPRSMVDLL